MECSASAAVTGVLHRSSVMSKSTCTGISWERIVVKPEQSAVRRARIIRASQCEYAPPFHSSSSSSSSLYDVLSVSPEVSEREIKRAYHGMALRYHPYICPPSGKEECTTKFLQIQQAYQTLADPLLHEGYYWKLENMLELGENE